MGIHLRVLSFIRPDNVVHHGPRVSSHLLRLGNDNRRSRRRHCRRFPCDGGDRRLRGRRLRLDHRQLLVVPGGLHERRWQPHVLILRLDLGGLSSLVSGRGIPVKREVGLYAVCQTERQTDLAEHIPLGKCALLQSSLLPSPHPLMAYVSICRCWVAR